MQYMQPAACTRKEARSPLTCGLFIVEIYCVVTTALWSRGGSAVVSLHPPAASMESSVL